MLDADAEGADWREASRIVLHIDAEREPDRARRAFDSHLARAKWISGGGYRALSSAGLIARRQSGVDRTSARACFKGCL
jgi:hypothetical protein